MCAPSPPPPPDTIGAANAQGAANQATALTQAHVNNPNVITPSGSRTVSWDGETPTITQTLSPAELAIYNQNAATRGTLAGLGSQGAQSLTGIIGKPLDASGLPASPDAYRGGSSPEVLDPRSLGDLPSAYKGPGNLPPMPQGSEALRQRVIDAMMTRENTDLAKRTDQTRSDLIAQGIRPGTEAYAREMDLIERSRNDARAQAEANAGAEVARAYGMDLSSRQEGQKEALDNAQLSFGQGMQRRGVQASEQGQRFTQQGQVAQQQQGQQAQTYAQQAERRRQAISEALTQRQVPLNEIIGLMSGSQVNNPFAGSAPTSGNGGFNGVNIAPPPIFGANQEANRYQTDVYNQQVGTANANTQAGATIAAGAIAAMF